MESERILSVISHKDIEMVTSELLSGQSLTFENFLNDLYLDEFINKPWGHEYRVYSDLFIDVWRLHIEPKQATSMHCHPRKETLLLCLKGSVIVSFLDQQKLLTGGDFVFIPKGVFHSTESVSDNPAHLIEVETPRNKFDLIRKKDKYGRQGKGYETEFERQNIFPLTAIDSDVSKKIRKYDLNNQYSFRYLHGSFIKTQTFREGAVAASLALEDAIAHRITIGKSINGLFEGLSPEKPYLVIEPCVS